MNNQAKGYAVVHRYQSDGFVQTKGFAKMVCALSNYEKAQLYLEEIITKKWRLIMDGLPEPTWWQTKKGLHTRVEAFKDQARKGKVDEQSIAVWILYREMTRDKLWTSTGVWFMAGRKHDAFNGNIKVIPWLQEYNEIRRLIRNGEAWHLPERLCHFINHWTTHTSIYV